MSSALHLTLTLTVPPTRLISPYLYGNCTGIRKLAPNMERVKVHLLICLPVEMSAEFSNVSSAQSSASFCLSSESDCESESAEQDHPYHLPEGNGPKSQESQRALEGIGPPGHYPSILLQAVRVIR